MLIVFNRAAGRRRARPLDIMAAGGVKADRAEAPRLDAAHPLAVVVG